MYKQILKNAVVVLLTWEAKLIVAKYKPYIIAITGSVGKTSTKDALFSVFSKKEFVRKSEKSFNSEIGVPLTIIGRPNAWSSPLGWFSNLLSGLFLIVSTHRYPKWLILEVGADRPGDIKKISSWLHPDVVVVTRFAPVPVHVEFFGSREAVINEKAELVRGLKEDGILALSADDDDVLALSALARKAKIVTFGFAKKADIVGSKVKNLYEGTRSSRHPSGVQCSLRSGDDRAEVSFKGSVGRQIIYAGLCASAVGKMVGMSLSESSLALTQEHKGPPGRMRLIAGIKHTTIIDDSYNSSPVAVTEALDSLKSLTAKGRKIAVLGDMLELGRFSVQEHKAIGTYVKDKIDKLFLIGVRSRHTADGALEAGFSAEDIFQFDDARTAGKALESFIVEGDLILIKGSQGIRTEKIVEEIMAHPEEKENLLVRQDREWQSR